jgi:hypothetical protein
MSSDIKKYWSTEQDDKIEEILTWRMIWKIILQNIKSLFTCIVGVRTNIVFIFTKVDVAYEDTEVLKIQYINNMLVYIVYTMLVLIQVGASTRFCIRNGTVCSLLAFYIQIPTRMVWCMFIIFPMSFRFQYQFKYVETDGSIVFIYF